MRRAGLSLALAAAAFAAAARAQETAAPATDLTREQEAAIAQLLGRFDQKAADADVFRFDYGVPDSPALTLLGLEKDKITQSNSLKPFVLALPGVISGDDSSKAIAADVSLAWLLGEDRRYRSYTGLGARDLAPGAPERAGERGTLRQLKYRTRLAAAAYGGVQDADPAKQVRSRLALGLSSSVLPDSDPVLTRLPGHTQSVFQECIRSGWPTIREQLAKPLAGIGLAAIEKAVLDNAADILDLRDKPKLSEAETLRLKQLEERREELKRQRDAARAESQRIADAAFDRSAASRVLPACRTVADLVARTSPDLDVGVGTVWEGAPGKLSQLNDNSTVVWASFRYPLRRYLPDMAEMQDWSRLESWAAHMPGWIMLGVSGRAGFNESLPTGDAATPQVRANRYSGWVGLEWNQPDLRITGEIGREKISPKLESQSRFGGARTRYLVAADYRLGDTGLWVNLSHGEAKGVGALKDDKVTRLTFSFSDPPPPDVLAEKRTAAGQD